MGSLNFILTYIESCASGRLGMSDCGPIWQLGVIVVFLLISIITLVILRLRARPGLEEA